MKGGARNVVAIDLGAESCRVSLATWANGRGSIKTVHRFVNGPVERDGNLYWEIARILAGVADGLRICADLADGAIDSIGIDGWAVDYVRMSPDSLPLEDPFCYRDERTTARQPELWKTLSAERIYSITGIQMLRFNTLYQLYADGCDNVAPSKTWLNIPEYVLHRLGGSAVAEYTNATHTQMVKAGTRLWSREIMSAAGIDEDSAPAIVSPGTIVGTLQGPLAQLPAFRETKLIAPACHDTGSAVAGIPSQGDDWAFLSSGTWSLIGTVLPRVCATEAARSANFSNEVGLGGGVRFLKNVNGMWLLQECLRHWLDCGAQWELNELISAAASLTPPNQLLNVDDLDLWLPGNMPARINAAMVRQGHSPLPEQTAHAPLFASLIFHSLAARYAELLREVTAVSGKKLHRLYIVGGGSRNEYLNRLVGERTGLEVVRGAVESSTVGNVAIQFAVLDGATEPQWGVLPEAVSSWSRCLAEAQPAFLHAQVDSAT